MFGYLDEVIRPFVLILSKMGRNVWPFKVKTYKNNKLMSFHIDDEKLLEKYKTIWRKIEDLKIIELNALPAYNEWYIKTKIRTYGDKVYTSVCCSNVQKDDIEWEIFPPVFRQLG